MRRLVYRPTIRGLLLTLVVGSTLSFVIWTFRYPDVTVSKQCFRLNPKIRDNIAHINFFEDVMRSKKKPISGKSIFFHETSCSKDGLFQLNARYLKKKKENCMHIINPN